jgi:hypothetical protein
LLIFTGFFGGCDTGPRQVFLIDVEVILVVATLSSNYQNKSTREEPVDPEAA